MDDGDGGLAARLLGANEPVARSIGLALQRYRHLLEHRRQCRARLDAHDSDLVRSGRQECASMRLEAAIQYALEDGTVEGTREDSSELDTLTRRERDVVELIAQGLTNREIAARLVISQRTAEGHVEKILGELGFHTRTQVAVCLATRRSAG